MELLETIYLSRCLLYLILIAGQEGASDLVCHTNRLGIPRGSFEGDFGMPKEGC